jgi:HlyD family secretion protein
MPWRKNEPMEQGQEVYELQEMIYLPTTTSMMAEIRIPESSLRKVEVGMPARVTVHAIPAHIFTGHAQNIDLMPDPISAWRNPDLKVYTSEVYIEGDSADLRVGMNCRVDIIVAEYDDTLYVPIQSVVRDGDKYAVYVRGDDGKELRYVEVGMDNNRMIHILSGLEEGEKVILDPPLQPSAKPESSEQEKQDAETLPEAQPNDQPATTDRRPQPSQQQNDMPTESPNGRPGDGR